MSGPVIVALDSGTAVSGKIGIGALLASFGVFTSGEVHLCHRGCQACDRHWLRVHVPHAASTCTMTAGLSPPLRTLFCF